MDKGQALHTFWSSFGLPALDEQSAYDEGTLEELEITYPYLTYETAIDYLDSPVSIGADLWYKSTSWEDITKKAEDIGAYIGLGGRVIRYDGGGLWITRGADFSRRMAEETGDDNIRRIHINIQAEFLSA
jgi:hypothetical protein